MSSETQNIPLPPVLSENLNKKFIPQCGGSDHSNNENNKNNCNTITRSGGSIVKFPECTWACHNPDIHKAFFLAKVCATATPRYCKYLDVRPILQTGPTCGLTAVSMLYNGCPSPEFLLDQSRRLGLTNNGEMFSVHNLLDLLRANLATSDMDVHAFMHTGDMNCDTIRNYLRNDNATILFPYDVDSNHRPCLKDGTKAHWALIVGSAVDLFDEFYVIARHGKSRNLAVWTLESVAKSNSNLNRVECSDKFVLPVGGISGDLGLKSKCIVIIGLNNRLINVV